MTVRNRKARARSQQVREQIRQVWFDLVREQPFERHTAKSIAQRLPFQLSRSAVQWHMDYIRITAWLERVI